jgi:uncharacterized protein (TIGR02391 family)
MAIAHPEEQAEGAPVNPFVFPVAEPSADLEIANEGAAAAKNDLDHLHDSIRDLVASLYVGEHYDHAILEAFKAVSNRVKRLTGLQEDGQSLMSAAMNPPRPLLRFNDGDSETAANEQHGLMLIFMGAMRAIRNPRAHDHLATGREEALEHLALASLLMRKLDQATVRRDE